MPTEEPMIPKSRLDQEIAKVKEANARATAAEATANAAEVRLAGLDATELKLSELTTTLETERGTWGAQRVYLGAGLDDEGIEVAELMFARRADQAQDRAAWVAGLKADPSSAPRALQGYLGAQGAGAAGAQGAGAAGAQGAGAGAAGAQGAGAAGAAASGAAGAQGAGGAGAAAGGASTLPSSSAGTVHTPGAGGGSAFTPQSVLAMTPAEVKANQAQLIAWANNGT